MGDDNSYFDEFLKNLGKGEEEELYGIANQIANQEAWESLFEMYKGLTTAGFPRRDAQELMAAYIVRLIGG